MEELVERIKGYLKEHGSIGAVRVSSAQARGRAKRYPYWGAVRYQIRLSRDGRVIVVPEERASSDRRSEILAWSDARDIAAAEGRVLIVGARGELRDWDVEDVVRHIGLQ